MMPTQDLHFTSFAAALEREPTRFEASVVLGTAPVLLARLQEFEDLANQDHVGRDPKERPQVIVRIGDLRRRASAPKVADSRCKQTHVERCTCRQSVIKDIFEKLRLEIQRDQLNRLVGLERAFRSELEILGVIDEVYNDFVVFIRDRRRSILSARPFFRERQTVFTESISPALEARDGAALQEFDVNSQFIQFAMRSRRWALKTERAMSAYGWWKAQEGGRPCGSSRREERLVRIVNEIFSLRNEIVESNIFLVINRACLFGKKTPPSHLSKMDLIQIAVEGMLAAIDKYVLPFTSVFRSVCIGRMVGNFIENYSATLIHFFPKERRKIYRGNKVVRFWDGMDGVNFDEIANAINVKACKACKGKPDVAPNCQECAGAGQVEVEDSCQTTGAEISSLMSAASCVSSSPVSTEDGRAVDLLSRQAASDDWRPDHRAEAGELHNLLQQGISMLTLPQQKLLRLTGVAIQR